MQQDTPQKQVIKASESKEKRGPIKEKIRK